MLDDINVYNRNDGTPNYFVATDKISIVYTQCLIDGKIRKSGQRGVGTLTSVYQGLINYINIAGTAIVEADVLKVFKDENGKTLEQLK